MDMSTQRHKHRDRTRGRNEQRVDPSLVEARTTTERELCELSEYLDACASERVSLGLWAETWAAE